MKKIFSSILILIILLSMCSTVFASDLKTELQIVKKASDTKYLENDQGYIVNSIKNIDKDTGELEVQVTLENVKKQNNNEQEIYENTEIFIIIPEYTETEENEKLNYIETLAGKILNNNEETKIGIIGIKGPIADVYIDENGNLVHNPGDEATVNGTENDAECIVELTDNIETLKTNLRKMNMDKKEYYNNLQAALRLAKNSFSTNTNKILISLYDDVPETAIGLKSQTSGYGGWFSQYSTAEEAVKAHLNDLVSKTKSEILAIKNAKIKFILLRPDDTEFDQTWYSSEKGEKICDIDGKPYADELYGTLENPTYGKMYSLNNDTMEKIVTEYIFNDIMQEVQPTISNIKIDNYFTKDIIESFDVIISNDKIDTTKLSTDNLISFNVEKLLADKTAILKYTLKIKDMKNKSLLNKAINITEKLNLSYMDYLKEEKQISLSNGPQIKLTEIKEEKEEIIEDDTIASGKIPYTGSSYIIISAIALIIIAGIVAKIKYNDLKDIK